MTTNSFSIDRRAMARADRSPQAEQSNIITLLAIAGKIAPRPSSPLSRSPTQATAASIARCAGAFGKKRLGRAQHIVDDAEEPEPRRFLLRRLRRRPIVVRRREKQLIEGDARVAGPRLLRHQHQQRHDHGADQ